MIFSWLQERRRRKILKTPMPAAWHEIIARNVWQDEYLSEAESQRLRQFVQVFVAEKNWEGLNGFVINDEVRVTIAAQAALLALHSQHYFEHVLSILVHPTEYVIRGRNTSPAGVITESNSAVLGQAVWRGPVILSWRDIAREHNAHRGTENLVLHEFAHQLDMMNGRSVDGVPPFHSLDELELWLSVMQSEFEQLQMRCRNHIPGIIRCYGAKDESEFLAVTVETFFERGPQLQQQYPELYEILRRYFGVDPAAWW